MKKTIFLLCLTVLFTISASRVVTAHQVQQQVADKVIRFHVLANSDSEEDQALKLSVRDQVGTYVGQRLDGVSDVSESRAMIEMELENIEACAEKTIKEQGYGYDVTASLENCYFPAKTYGDATFPPGEYQALRVVIGEGRGKNWWCVLYPNLCFSGNLYKVDASASTQELQKVLRPEEYKLIMENKEYEISFRIPEVLEEIFTKR